MTDPSEKAARRNGRASRRTVLGLAAASSAEFLLPGQFAYADGDPGTQDEPAPENHYDVTKVRPEDLQPPRIPTQAACGSTVYPHAEIGNQPTFYELSGRATSFGYDATFYGRLEAWLSFFFANTPTLWARPAQLWSYGAYVNRNDGCVSFHNRGRAFDLSRLYATNPTVGTLNGVFNARYDQWRTQAPAVLAVTRRRYWATAASLHYHFKHVLTYLYNAEHANHIHVDNAVSGAGNATFSTASTAQVQHVQACAVYVWGRSLAIDGVWGPKTAAAVGAVLNRIGRAGALTSQANWLSFNRATLRRGSGAQSY